MTDLRTPPLSDDGDLFSERARQYALEKPLQRIHILEAGCGWGTGLDLGDHERHTTGVDLECPELRAHTCARPDLDDWHLGDLRTVPLPPRAFDVVHASYLIERVPHAELVLDRFVAALKPGGLLLVHLRDRDTAYGFLDRMLPRWLHPSRRSPRPGRGRRPERGLRAKRGLRPSRGPGRGSRGAHARVPNQLSGTAAARPARPVRPAWANPPPAVYDRVASSAGMRWYCVMRGLVICEEYTSRHAVEALGAGSGPAWLLCRLVSALTRGRLTARHSEVTFVIRKPENRFARVI